MVGGRCSSASGGLTEKLGSMPIDEAMIESILPPSFTFFVVDFDWSSGNTALSHSSTTDTHSSVTGSSLGEAARVTGAGSANMRAIKAGLANSSSSRVSSNCARVA